MSDSAGEREVIVIDLYAVQGGAGPSLRGSGVVPRLLRISGLVEWRRCEAAFTML